MAPHSNRFGYERKVAFGLGIFLTVAASLSTPRAQQSPKAAPRPTAHTGPAPAVWKSKTTDREYRVKVSKSIFNAEWVNISPALQQHGAYIRTKCRREGNKWVGTSQSYLPCTTAETPPNQYANWCHLETKFEVQKITADRITGQGESLKRFDCQKCKIIETEWAAFVWAPKR